MAITRRKKSHDWIAACTSDSIIMKITCDSQSVKLPSWKSITLAKKVHVCLNTDEYLWFDLRHASGLYVFGFVIYQIITAA